jgi:hypothetical protein
LLQASAPPQISSPPTTIATTPRTALPRLAMPSTVAPEIITPSLASVPALSFATSAPVAAPNPPPALPRAALNTTSPELIASVGEKPLNLLSLKVSPPAITSEPTTPRASPTQTPPQFAPQPEASTEIAPPLFVPTVAAQPVFAPTAYAPPSVPVSTPASPTVAVLPTAPIRPSALQNIQPGPRLVLPQRAALETQSATMQLALSIAPQRPFQLKATATSVLAATATLPPSIVQAALLNPALSNPLPAAAVIAAQSPDPVTPAVATTITAAQLQALPASGRRWQEFLLDTPAASASSGSPSQVSFLGSQQSAGIAVDGVNTSLAFGVFAGSGMRASDSTGAASDPQSSTMQSGSQAWTGGRGLGVSEAAIREVTAAAGNVEADGMRSASGLTTVHTESGSNALHGQGSLFDRQNTWGARNPYTQWVKETAPANLTFNPSGSVPVFTPEPYTPLAATSAAISSSGLPRSTAIAATIRDWRWLNIPWTFAGI